MNSHTRLHLTASLFLLLLGPIGCSTPPAAAVSDPSLARTTLSKALDSWKNGDPSDALSKASPVVYVADQDWQAGTKLESYTIEPTDQMFGTSLRCPVSLNLKDSKGKSVTRKVAYLVTTDPVLRVDREE